MLVAVLAILKAGGAYVPLSRSYPRERLRFMLEDSGVSVLLTSSGIAEELPAPGVRVIELDSAREEIDRYDGSKLESSATLENLLYVLYTSGSTGQPKGIALPHCAGANLIRWELRNSEAPPAARTLLFSPLSFDASFTDMFMAWCSGGTLVMAGEQERLDPERLGVLLREEAVERINLPYVALNALAGSDAGAPQPLLLPALREVLSTAEQLQITPELREWFRRHPQVTLQNQYGPSETHVVTALKLDTAAADWPVLPSIGRPIANTRIYILDPRGEPAPVGVVGDLYIAGDGLARGYLHRPELTLEKFVPDPFSGVSGDRMYRTEDLARWRADGTIEFLGRADHLIKVRGYRVEPGEVETVMRQHPGVKEAVAGVWEPSPGDQRLVAYVVASGAGACSAGELREHLRQRLPDYMIPSVVTFLDKLPLTPSGKVDRKALPEPDVSRTASTGHVPTANPISKRNWPAFGVGFWAWNPWCIEDNFFELGGHSILVTRLVAQVRKVLKMDLPLRAVFETPTIERLVERLETAPVNAPHALERRTDTPFLPVSFAQERLWFIDCLEPGSPLYNIPWATWFNGALDVIALKNALNGLVARHEALRTTFRDDGEHVIQIISPARELELREVDLTSSPEAGRKEEVLRLLRREARRPFDLSRDRMLRGVLLKLGGRDWILGLTLHHIAGDGWSLEVASREIKELYVACCDHREPRMPEIPIRYADYAAWQREWLTGDVLEDQLSYWRRQLDGLSVLQVSTDKRRPAVPTHSGGRLEATLPEELVNRLRALGQREGATLFVTLLAAFQSLLHRYSGQDDIAVGSPVANRDRPETQGVIGFFVNTLVLRGDFSDDPTFRQLLGRVRATVIEAYHHQEVPFEKLVEALRPERDHRVSPLFQVMFALEEENNRNLELPGLSSHTMDIGTGTAKFDLTLSANAEGNRLGCVLSYSTELFERQTAERMMQHFQNLLASAAADPDCSISRLPILSEGERRQLLAGWNNERREFPLACVHELFEQQAARCPGEMAVVFEGNAITYGELDQRANQVAHQLKDLGVGPEMPVGICTERSVEMIIGVLGILKSGGAYVPLDPAYPVKRLSFMLEDSGARVLLFQNSLAHDFSRSGCELIPLESAGQGFPEEPPTGGSEPGNLAYVMYTSGSTGKPKGVEITHRNVVGLLHSFQPLAGERRIGTNVATFSFDTSVEEIFANLCYGGTLHIIRPELSADARRFARYLIDHNINFCYVVPDLIEQLAAELAPFRDGVKLRCLVTGLAPKRQSVLQKLRDVFPHLRILNAYGPTEVTYGATAFEFQTATDPDRDVPIGRPFANYPVYIVDEALQPVPIGVAGELLIGGVGVARGYRNRPELTAERFTPDPFGDEPGARLYRTGDLTRYLPDGNIEFLGRIDSQLKIRGFRIEPGEIEATLVEYDGIDRAIVIAVESPAGDRRLVAYVVSDGGATISTPSLRAFIRDRLPAHMVPAVFVYLDALPLMTNGKLDRKALPAPDLSREDLETECILPRTPLEESVAGMWSEILGIEQLGVHDNFFDLGGHSLLAMRLVARVRQELQVELPLRDVFEAPTVAGLVKRLGVARNVEMPPLRRVSRSAPLPLSFAQQRLWLLDGMEPVREAYSVPGPTG